MASFDGVDDDVELRQGVEACLMLCDPTYWIAQCIGVAVDCTFEFWKGFAMMAVATGMAEMP